MKTKITIEKLSEKPINITLNNIGINQLFEWCGHLYLRLGTGENITCIRLNDLNECLIDRMTIVKPVESIAIVYKVV